MVHKFRFLITIKILHAIVLMLTSPATVFAQTRGGTCQSLLCGITGGLVGSTLLGFFLLSVYHSIATHGFWHGIIRHAGVRAFITYIGIVGGILLLASVAYEVLGKEGAVLALFLMIAIIAFYERRSKSRI